MTAPDHEHEHGSCRDVADRLLRVRDGDLGAEETELLRLHLHMCPMCMDLLRSYDEVVDVLRRLQPVKMPAGLLGRLKKGMQEV